MRVLVSAYACAPDQGSEQGVGWHRIRQLARFHEVWVITRVKNRIPIEAAMAQEPLPNVHWIYHDLPRWARFWKKKQRGIHLYYYLWQLTAYLRARGLHRQVGFDQVHHVTFVNYWLPSFLALLPVPFIWGPVGGGEAPPASFWRCYSPRGKVFEILRAIAQRIGEKDPFLRATARRAAVALATTESTAKRLKLLGCRDVIVYSEAGLPHEEIDRLSGIPNRRNGLFRLVSLGDLLHLKGFELGLKAFAQFHKNVPESEYWFMGEGPERERLEKIAQELGVSHCVKFWGRIPRSAVLEKLEQCDALVHPSLHDSGGWVCIEAMAGGRPVICLDLGGPGFQVTEQTGFKVKPITPKQAVADLARAMEQLAENPELRARMGEAGRQRVRKYFAWDRKGEWLRELGARVARLDRRVSTSYGMQKAGSQTIKPVAALISFMSLGFLAFLYPGAAVVLFGLIVTGLGLAFARSSLLTLVVVGAVLAPTIGLLRTDASKAVATQLATTIEAGSIQNRLAATVLLAVGIVHVFRGRKLIREVNLVPWLALFLALDYASMLWSQSAALTLRRSTEALFVTVFALGIGSMYYARRPRGDIELLKMICWATSILIASVMAVFIVHGDFHPASPAWRLGHTGVENQIGWVSAVGLIITWVIRKRSDIWENKWSLWFNLSVPGLGVLLSKSRETWLGVLAALFIVELFKPYSLKKKVTGVLAVVCVIGAFALVPVLAHMWTRGASEKDLETVSGRTDLWEAAMPMIRSHLLLGYGYGAFWDRRMVLRFSSNWNPTSLHNGYMQTTAEIGLTGLFLISAGVAVSARNAWRLMKHPQNAEIGLALLALYSCFLVSDFFGGVLEVFNYFPATAILTYSFFVSYRLRLLDANRSTSGAQNILVGRERYAAQFGDAL